MDIVLIIIFWLAVVPLTTLVHELGHGIGGVLSTKERTMAILGPADQSNKRTFSVGRMDFHIKWAYFGFCSIESNRDLSAFQRIVIAAGGHVVPLLIALTSFIILFIDLHYEIKNLLTAIAIFNFWQCICTAIPIIYPSWFGPYSGIPSDGYRIVRGWKDYKLEKGARS